MLAMAVHTARRNKAEEVKCTVFFHSFINDRMEGFIFKERAVTDRTCNACKILIYDASRADVRMSYLGVAHLPIRQTNSLSRA